jgi:broad specificity phosphatase PhoE
MLQQTDSTLVGQRVRCPGERERDEMGKNQPLRVLLVTVGETIWERQGRIPGRADLPLSPEGINQARAQLRRQTRPWMGTILHAGDEASASVASEILDHAYGEPGLRVVEGLHEIDLGLWEGLLEDEVAEKFPTTYRQWKEDPWVVNCPSGEDLAQAQERVVEALRKALAKVKPGTGAVAIVLRPIVATLIRLAMTRMDRNSETNPETEQMGFWEACARSTAPLWCTLPAEFTWRLRSPV